MNKPEILARFELEDDGSPAYVKGDSLKHYAIQLFLRDAPDNVSLVTYKLDPTYREPTRKVPSAVPEFAESLTSYGDYEVRAMLDAGKARTAVSTSLSEALRRYYGEQDAAPEVRKAIEYIERH